MDLLVAVIVTLIILGLALWLVSEFLPIDARLKLFIQALLVVLAIIYLLQVSGMLSGIDT